MIRTSNVCPPKNYKNKKYPMPCVRDFCVELSDFMREIQEAGSCPEVLNVINRIKGMIANYEDYFIVENAANDANIKSSINN